eukprot:scaffold120_cov59-Cylindrotheca_fusiformis.AAC.9
MSFTTVLAMLLVVLSSMCLMEAEAWLPEKQLRVSPLKENPNPPIRGGGGSGRILEQQNGRGDEALSNTNHHSTTTTMTTKGAGGGGGEATMERSSSSFNEEVYRQEMTTLVYQRSMQRGFSF